ncbi:MAG TPA: EthD family reductase [Blastocatellia bacterium]|nr:EthD family reductase [Blastocatellia bacterium]
MAEVKILVIYPRPTDVDAFEKAYIEEHVPLAKAKIKGVTKFVATRVIGAPDGSTPPFYRIAELHFASMDALQQSASSPETQEAVKHAFEISTGGSPVIMVAEEETMTF